MRDFMSLNVDVEFINSQGLSVNQRYEFVRELERLDMLMVSQICRYDSYLHALREELSKHTKIVKHTGNGVGVRGITDGFRQKTLRVKRNDQSTEQSMLRFSLAKNLSHIYKLLVEFDDSEDEQERDSIKSKLSVFIASMIWLGEFDIIVNTQAQDYAKRLQTCRLLATKALKENGISYKGAGLDFLVNPHKFDEPVRLAVHRKLAEQLAIMTEETGIMQWTDGSEWKILVMLKDCFEQQSKVKEIMLMSVRNYIRKFINNNYSNFLQRYWGEQDDINHYVLAKVSSVLKRYEPDKKLTTFARTQTESVMTSLINKQALVNVDHRFSNYRKKIHDIVKTIEDEYNVSTQQAVAKGIDDIRKIDQRVKDISQEEVFAVIQFSPVKTNYDNDDLEGVAGSDSEQQEESSFTMSLQRFIKNIDSSIEQHAMAVMLNAEIDGFEEYIYSEDKLNNIPAKNLKAAQEAAKRKLHFFFEEQNSRVESIDFTELLDNQINPAMQHFIAVALAQRGFVQYTMYESAQSISSAYDKQDIKQLEQRAQTLIEQYQNTLADIDYEPLINEQLNAIMGHFIAQVLVEMGHDQYRAYQDDGIIPSYFDEEDIVDKRQRASELIDQYNENYAQ